MGSIGNFFSNYRFLPGSIIAVDLLAISRRKWFFILRFLFACALLYSFFTTYGSMQSHGLPTRAAITAAASTFFATFGFIQIFALLLIGPAAAAGAIATERERRTIEYLFTSTLTNAEIILGKLAARLLSILSILLAGVPVMALAMLFGGIPPQSILILWIITFSTATFIAVVSVCISVFAKRARDAIIQAYLIFIVLFWIAPWLAFLIIGQLAVKGTALAFMTDINPILAFYTLVNQQGNGLSYSTVPWEAMVHLVVNQAIVAGVLGLLATIMLRRVHLRAGSRVSKKRRWRLRWISVPIGNNPMLWKELWAEPSARLGWAGLFALTCIYAAVLSSWFFDITDIHVRLAISTGVSTTVASFAVLLIGARAACGVSSEKERDCWDTLISTSLSAREIVFAKTAGSAWSVRAAMPLLLLAWLPSVIINPMSLIAAAIQFVTLVALAIFAAALGTRISLGAKSSMRSMAATVAILLFVGGGYLWCLCPCGVILGSIGPRGNEVFVTAFICPCIPYLLVVTSMIGTSETFLFATRNSEAIIFLGYFPGMAVYCFSAWACYAMSVNSFDLLSGRSRRRPLIVATVVEGQDPSSTTP